MNNRNTNWNRFLTFLGRPFPLEHKKLMFMFRIMIMLMILMPLVGTKLYAYACAYAYALVKPALKV